MRHDVLTDGIPNRCERCYATDVSLTMSKFNTEMICYDCEKEEKAHDKYEEAVKAEEEAVKRGNYNFPGIGKPEDL